ncbi:MAG TPA: hypothetical protein VLH56_03210 [Dissulfurispiraceae bacterium]|nr:hypothetical protein [Dissulfurispiraceae bacterium]
MKLQRARRCVQGAFLGLLVAIPFLNEREISFITGTLYSMSFGPIDVTDPLSGLQVMMLTMSATQTLIISILIPVAFTFVFGRRTYFPNSSICLQQSSLQDVLFISTLLRIPAGPCSHSS